MLNIYVVTDWYEDGFETYPVDEAIIFAPTPEHAVHLSGWKNGKAEQIGWKTGEQEEGIYQSAFMV
jgi:hypothetical protein